MRASQKKQNGSAPRRGGRHSPPPKGSIKGGANGALRALFRFWPGEPFLRSDQQEEIARLLYQAGHKSIVMKPGNLSVALSNPAPSREWQLQVVDVLRLKVIGLDEKVLLEDEETAFETVSYLLQNEWPSSLESNSNAKGIIVLTHHRRS